MGVALYRVFRKWREEEVMKRVLNEGLHFRTWSIFCVSVFCNKAFRQRYLKVESFNEVSLALEVQLTYN